MIGFFIACLIGTVIALILTTLEVRSQATASWLEEYEDLRRLEDELDEEMYERIRLLGISSRRPASLRASRESAPVVGGLLDQCACHVQP